MERPENCPDVLYKLMQKCWNHRPTARPTFMEIIRYLLDRADPHFREVSFYHSEEAKNIRSHMQEGKKLWFCLIFIYFMFWCDFRKSSKLLWFVFRQRT